MSGLTIAGALVALAGFALVAAPARDEARANTGAGVFLIGLIIMAL